MLISRVKEILINKNRRKNAERHTFNIIGVEMYTINNKGHDWNLVHL